MKARHGSAGKGKGKTRESRKGRHLSFIVKKYKCVVPNSGLDHHFVCLPGTPVPGFLIPCLRHCFYMRRSARGILKERQKKHLSGQSYFESDGTAPIRRLLSRQTQYRISATLFQILFRKNAFDDARPGARCNVLRRRGWNC